MIVSSPLLLAASDSHPACVKGLAEPVTISLPSYFLLCPCLSSASKTKGGGLFPNRSFLTHPDGALSAPCGPNSHSLTFLSLPCFPASLLQTMYLFKSSTLKFRKNPALGTELPTYLLPSSFIQFSQKNSLQPLPARQSNWIYRLQKGNPKFGGFISSKASLGLVEVHILH